MHVCSIFYMMRHSLFKTDHAERPNKFANALVIFWVQQTHFVALTLKKSALTMGKAIHKDKP
jgi:hypothetical protein